MHDGMMCVCVCVCVKKGGGGGVERGVNTEGVLGARGEVQMTENVYKVIKHHQKV